MFLKPLPSRRAGHAYTLKKALFVTTVLGVSGCSLSGSQPVGYQNQIAVGEQLINVGQFDQAYNILEDVSRSNHNVAEAQFEVGDSFLRANALLRAESAYERVAVIGNDKLANIGRGKLALKRNNAEDALFHFQKALENKGADAEALNGIGVAYDLAGQHKLAQDSYRKALSQEPGYRAALSNLGLSQVLSGNADAGATTLFQLVASRLDNTTTRMNLAIALNSSGRSKDATVLASENMSATDAKRIFAAVTNYTRNSTGPKIQ